MGAPDLAQNIAPVIVVLDKISLGKAKTVSEALSSDADSWNSKIAGLVKLPLDAILGEDGFI